MRWYALFKDGDLRVVRRFLWLPVRLGRETRWLETALINQRLSGPLLPKWLNTSWAEEETDD